MQPPPCRSPARRQQHPRARRRNPVDGLTDLGDTRRPPHQLQRTTSTQAQFLVLALEAVCLNGAFDQEQQAVGLEGLLDEVVSAKLDG